MNVLKKLGAFALVVMLAVCFCVAASADTLGNVVSGNDITSLAFTTTLNAGVHLAGDVTYTIGDAAVISAATNNPTAPSVTFDSNTSTTVSIDAGSGGYEDTVDLDLMAGGANDGIYEFPITQGLPAAFSPGTYTVLYLTVVVDDGNVTQAVLHTESRMAAGQAPGSDHAVAGSKVAGFEYSSANTSGGDVTLQKFVAGAFGTVNTGNFNFIIEISASGNADLPFTVSSSSGTLTAYSTGISGATGTIQSGENASALDSSGAAKFGVTLNGTVTGGATFTIRGLPEDATVRITEADDTTDSVSATYTPDGTTVTTLSLTDKSGEVSVLAADTTNAVVFTNTYESISLTGVSLRYAPYLLTLGAGLVFLPMTRSYRRREDI